MWTRSLASRSFQAVSRRCASTLVVSEALKDSAVPAATCAAVTAASQLGTDGVHLLVVGPEAPTQIPVGVSKVLFANTSSTVAETVAATTATAAAGDYSHVLACSTKAGSTSLPRSAALMGVSPLSDVLEIRDPNTFVRPFYAGNALCTIKAHETKICMTIRPTAFEPAALEASSVETEEIAASEFADTTFVSASGSENNDRPDLGSAKVVVSGGRGMGEGANFALLEKLADALGGGAVGASRAAVDAGMVPNDWQVGQTGKVVAPKLYIAVGISGAIQHLSGMKDSQTIVAINKDPDAPIFQVADYGLVADLFEAVPVLTEKVKA